MEGLKERGWLGFSAVFRRHSRHAWAAAVRLEGTWVLEAVSGPGGCSEGFLPASSDMELFLSQKCRVRMAPRSGTRGNIAVQVFLMTAKVCRCFVTRFLLIFQIPERRLGGDQVQAPDFSTSWCPSATALLLHPPLPPPPPSLLRHTPGVSV